MQEIKTYKTCDLVLKVTKTYDLSKLDLTLWDRYLDILTDHRTYQKEAIQTTIVYLVSGKYVSIEDLVRENWQDTSNTELRDRYKDIEDYNRHIQLPDKLSGTIDLATGTGKSYVIYGIAQIMLGLGLVNKVLVLCPSLTIEKGLMDKFNNELTSNTKLRAAIPPSAKFKNPRIINADKTIKEGDICIENIHAVYERTGSSIRDSLKGKGEKVLVLNDEAHHIFSPIAERGKKRQNIRKWKEFLISADYNFKYILGFTGTAYVDDDYFNNVIYRYSLRQAVDHQMVKMVDYVSKDDSIGNNVKLQKIYDNHQKKKDNYPRLKPLTILITKDITNCKRLTEELMTFLEKKEDLPREKIEKKVLIVTSHNDHKANIAQLDDVDKKKNTIEWITSVSMLTEGWDVKNVFQIVPWEDRAFNSKLLIAQVLGRGLRIPQEYQTPQPEVRVFNHDAWSRNIKGLVDEILEIEMKLTSSVIQKGERYKYNFELYNINYDKEQQEKESTKDHKIFDYTKEDFGLIAQIEEDDKETEYTSLSGQISSKRTLIQYNTYTVDEVINGIYEDFKNREWEGKILKLKEGEYTKNELPPKDYMKRIIKKSMNKRGIKGNRLIEKNAQRIFRSFDTLLRKKGKTTRHIRKATEPNPITTLSMDNESMAIGNLRHRSGIFYSTNFKNEIQPETLEILSDLIIKNEDSLGTNYNLFEVNEYLFKTPLDMVFVSHDPEFKFIRHLAKKENTEKMDAWIKSRDSGFYSIEYSITTSGGKHTKHPTFNPDFFIKISKNKMTYFIVIEIKSDNDDSQENKAKLKWTRQHFNNLNEELKKAGKKQHYIFHFLSPNSYAEFFQYLRDGRLLKNQFGSELESKLVEINGNGG